MAMAMAMAMAMDIIMFRNKFIDLVELVKNSVMDEYHTIFYINQIHATASIPTYKFYISILILYFIDAKHLKHARCR
jgi:hypothetical protein